MEVSDDGIFIQIMFPFSNWKMLGLLSWWSEVLQSFWLFVPDVVLKMCKKKKFVKCVK